MTCSVRDEQLPTHTTRPLWRGLGVRALDFRCREHTERPGPEELSPSHSIVLVRRGLFRRHWLGQTFVADANSVVFFNAGEPSRYGHPVAGGDDCTIVALPERVVRALLRPVVPAESEAAVARFRFGHALASPLLARLHFQWLAAARRGGPAIVLEDMTTALLDEAVAAAYRARTEVGAPFRASAMVRRRHRELAEEAKIVINANVATPPSLAELADRFGCSPFHLSRVFRSEAGISLRRYVARLRAALAGAHLARERGTRRAGLTDTALAFGYADHSHFTNSFRAELGMTPSRFRDSFR